MDTDNLSLHRQFPHGLDRSARPAAILPAKRSSLLSRFVIALLRWQDRARQRQHLAALDPRMLRDMGMTPDEVSRQLAKAHWRR